VFPVGEIYPIIQLCPCFLGFFTGREAGISVKGWLLFSTTLNYWRSRTILVAALIPSDFPEKQG